MTSTRTVELDAPTISEMLDDPAVDRLLDEHADSIRAAEQRIGGEREGWHPYPPLDWHPTEMTSYNAAYQVISDATGDTDGYDSHIAAERWAERRHQ